MINPRECQTRRRDHQFTPTNLRPFSLLRQAVGARTRAGRQYPFGAHSRDDQAEIGGRMCMFNRLGEQIDGAPAEDERHVGWERMARAREGRDVWRRCNARPGADRANGEHALEYRAAAVARGPRNATLGTFAFRRAPLARAPPRSGESTSARETSASPAPRAASISD